ncbi:C-C motif chemokine 18-like isoform X2 [Heterodontus francisci]
MNGCRKSCCGGNQRAGEWNQDVGRLSPAIQSNPSMPEKELTDSSTTVLVCPTPGVLFKTTGGLQICMDPKEMWMQKALDILKKRFQQG